jgi:hypothetical protein
VLSVLIAILGPVTEARRLPSTDRAVRFTTRHAGGATATASLTLHASPAELGQSYRFSGDDGDIVLPEPELDRAAIYARAADALVSAIRSGARGHPCDVALGAETVRILESIDDDPRSVVA